MFRKYPDKPTAARGQTLMLSGDSEFAAQSVGIGFPRGPAFDRTFENAVQRFAQAEGTVEDCRGGLRLVCGYPCQPGRPAAVHSSGPHAPGQQIFVGGDFVADYTVRVIPRAGAAADPASGRVDKIQAEPSAHKFYR